MCLKNYHIRRLLDWIIAGVFNVFFPLFNISLLSVLHFRGHTRRQPRRWQSTTVTTTSSSCGPYGQTTCLSSASRCSAVSRRVFGENEPSVPHYLWKISSDKHRSSWLYWGSGGHESHTEYLLPCCQSCGDVSQQFCLDKLFLWMHQMVNSASQCWYFYLIPLLHRVTNKQSVITQCYIFKHARWSTFIGW